MKTLQVLSVFFLITLSSCSSVWVSADYDKKANFTSYKTFAYSRAGLDKSEISDLDKKRILYAVDEAMSAKGFTKSENPDVLVNLYTKERDIVNVTNWGMGFGWGWGWNPWWGGNVSTNHTPEGTLFIELIDAKTKELVWQGKGVGDLETQTEYKDARIKEFATKILEKYPPQIK